LQIVRTLVVAELGGRLEVAPQAGGGTRVLVEIPLEPAAGTPDGDPEQEETAEPGDRTEHVLEIRPSR
jgi:hypothetical protein